MNVEEEMLVEDLAGLTTDPYGFTMYAFPWSEQGELLGSSGPRPWQMEVLQYIGDHMSDPVRRLQPCQVAVSSGHGIGKSALIGQVIQWAMSTCEDCRVVLTANTETQLRTKTWPEVSKWLRLSINSHWWNLTATNISVREKSHERMWRADTIPWSENNTEAFAGLHNKGKRIVVIYDEASAIADKIWEVTEGALTDEDTEIIWLAFGNPTQNTGRFRECFGRYKHRWKTFQIDSRKVEGTNKEQISKWIADYGEDSDFVRVRVRGEFPRAGSTQLISGESVAAARNYVASGYEHLPKILAVDVARFGDDQTVIGKRQGSRFEILKAFRGLDTQQVAARVIEYIAAERPDGVVVDGDGIGAGVVDALRHQGHGSKLREFHGGANPNDGDMYFNHRAEVWGLTRDWLKDPVQIPDDPELETDLTGPEYFFSSKNQIQLEKKEDMKKRGLASPDKGDTLAMTFAFKIEIRRTFQEKHDEAVNPLIATGNYTAANLLSTKMQAARKGKARFTGRQY